MIFNYCDKKEFPSILEILYCQATAYSQNPGEQKWWLSKCNGNLHRLGAGPDGKAIAICKENKWPFPINSKRGHFWRSLIMVVLKILDKQELHNKLGCPQVWNVFSFYLFILTLVRNWSFECLQKDKSPTSGPSNWRYLLLLYLVMWLG